MSKKPMPWEDDSLAPNGRPVKDNFAEWFGQSKVVDAEGKPLVVYHGTARTVIERDDGLSEFMGSHIAGWFGPDPVIAEQYANKFPDDNELGEVGQQIYPVYLSIKNSFRWKGCITNRLTAARAAADLAAALGVGVDMVKAMVTNSEQPAWKLVESRAFVDLLKTKGYDSIRQNERGFETFAAFYPTQIKSAIGNNGNYDRNNLSMSDCPADAEFEPHPLRERCR